MKFREHESAVLLRSLPEQGLHANDLGVVVHVHSGGGLEVEFVRPDGRTQSVVTLDSADVRHVQPTDMTSVREAALPESF